MFLDLDDLVKINSRLLYKDQLGCNTKQCCHDRNFGGIFFNRVAQIFHDKNVVATNFAAVTLFMLNRVGQLYEMYEIASLLTVHYGCIKSI